MLIDDSFQFATDDGLGEIPVVYFAIHCLGVLQDLLGLFLVEGFPERTHYFFQVSLSYIPVFVYNLKMNNLRRKMQMP